MRPLGARSLGSRSLWLVSLAFRRFLLGSALLAIEPLLATSLIALALMLLERLPWIPMHSAGSPVASAGFSGFLKGAFRLLGRRPQLSALEPLHHSIRMALLQATQRRQQIVALGRAKRRR